MEKRGIGIQLRMLNNAVRRYLDHYSVVKKEIDSVSCSNGWIVGYICEMKEQGREVYQRDLENNFGITRSTASKVLGLMEKKGLVERTSVSHDARLKKIIPTERSLEIGRVIKYENEKMENLLKKGFTARELDTLYEYFERIQNNLDTAEPDTRKE